MNFLKKVMRRIRRVLSNKSSAQYELEQLKLRGLKLGHHVDIFSSYPFDSLYPGLITVGDYVTISSDVKILAHDASMGYLVPGMVKIGVVEIGNHVFIGRGVTILCNVHIGDYAVIGAGSVVTCDVPANTVYAGNPARFIKTSEEFAQQHLRKAAENVAINRPWQEVVKSTPDEWTQLREQLSDASGYIIREKKESL